MHSATVVVIQTVLSETTGSQKPPRRILGFGYSKHMSNIDLYITGFTFSQDVVHVEKSKESLQCNNKVLYYLLQVTAYHTCYVIVITNFNDLVHSIFG